MFDPEVVRVVQVCEGFRFYKSTSLCEMEERYWKRVEQNVQSGTEREKTTKQEPNVIPHLVFLINGLELRVIGWRDEDVHKKNVETILQKVFGIREPNTIPNHEAVMVHFHAASIALTAVLGARRLEWIMHQSFIVLIVNTPMASFEI
jgi:hypothetical protein